MNCSTELKFGTEYYHSIAGMLQMFKVKGQRSRSHCNVRITYQQKIRSKKATDRLSDFKLGMSVVINADKDWRLKLQYIAIVTFSSRSCDLDLGSMTYKY